MLKFQQTLAHGLAQNCSTRTRSRIRSGASVLTFAKPMPGAALTAT
jgi:hypothetical protein